MLNNSLLSTCFTKFSSLSQSTATLKHMYSSYPREQYPFALGGSTSSISGGWTAQWTPAAPPRPWSRQCAGWTAWKWGKWNTAWNGWRKRTTVTFPLSKMSFRTNYICYYNNLYSYHDTFLSPVQLTFLLNNERPQLLLLGFPLLRVRLQKVASSDCLSNFHWRLLWRKPSRIELMKPSFSPSQLPWTQHQKWQ